MKITPLSADLDFKATYNGKRAHTAYVPQFTHTLGYYAVIFTDSTLPRQMPEQPLYRSWRRADPNATPDSYWHSTDINNCPNLPYPSAYCSLNVKESGVLTSTTRVNGVVHTDSACVQCALNDSLIDNDLVRAALLNLAEQSHGTDPNPANRIEKNLAIVRDNSTGQIVPYQFDADSADNCHSVFHAFLIPGGTVLAYVHTHPIFLNDSMPCAQGGTGIGVHGGSVRDWKMMKTLNTAPTLPQGAPNVKMYILANDYVYRMD